MKYCRHAHRLLELQFAGELDWKQELQLLQHLEDCTSCAALASAQKQVLESLGSYREPPLARVDVERFVERVQNRIADVPVGTGVEEFAPQASHGRFWALAAAILVVLGLSWALRTAPKTTDPLVEGVREAPQSEVEPALATASEESDFRAERHRAAVADLRGALASLMGTTPDRELYRDRVQGLRADGWPMVGLLSGLLGDDQLEIASAAVSALGEEGNRLAYRRLWNLRKDERLAQEAMLELQVRGELTLENVVELYWMGSFDGVVKPILSQWKGPEALQAAQVLVENAQDRRVPIACYADLVGLLGRAGVAGSEQALAWLQDSRWLQEPWAAELARALDLSESLPRFIHLESGARWESGALALAAHKPDEQWVPFLETRCGRSRTASRAVELLANQPGKEALDLLLEQERNRMVPEDVWLHAWHRALDGDAARLVEWTRSYRSSHSRGELEHLADVLLLGDQPGTGEALVELALSEDLPPRLRCTLALQAGQLGDVGAELGLRTLFSSLQREDSDLAACVSLALGQVLDAAQLTEWFESQIEVGAILRNEIVALCDPQSRRSERERRYLIARKLKPVLGRRNPVSLE